MQRLCRVVMMMMIVVLASATRRYVCSNSAFTVAVRRRGIVPRILPLLRAQQHQQQAYSYSNSISNNRNSCATTTAAATATTTTTTTSSSSSSNNRLAIVGGGLAGLSTAYHFLDKCNKDTATSVTIWDSKAVGEGGASAVAGGYVQSYSNVYCICSLCTSYSELCCWEIDRETYTHIYSDLVVKDYSKYLLLLMEPRSWRQYISPRSMRRRETLYLLLCICSRKQVSSDYPCHSYLSPPSPVLFQIFSSTPDSFTPCHPVARWFIWDWSVYRQPFI